MASVAPAGAKFTIEGNCADAELSVGATCRMEATFAPQEAGESRDTLEISYKGRNGNNEVVHVPLSGVATPVETVDSPPPVVESKLDVNPSEVPFTLPKGEKANAVKVTVSNIGDGGLSLNRVEIVRGMGQFFSENGCANVKELAPHSNCVVVIYPNTSTAGQFVGTLLISTREEDREIPLSAQIVQNAIAVAKVRPTSVRFDALERPNVIAAFFGSLMSAKVVHVLSEGNAPLIIDHWEYTSPYFADGQVKSGRECRQGLHVDPKQECLIQVNFRQGAPSTTAELKIYDNRANNPQSVQLVGVVQARLCRSVERALIRIYRQKLGFTVSGHPR